mgnify:CR=1 FL=1
MNRHPDILFPSPVIQRGAVLALLLSAGLLQGCSLFGGGDNTEPPAKLESFEKRVELRRLWSQSTGKGTDEQRLKLVPAVSAARVYAADRSGSVWAFELDSGKVVWRRKNGEIKRYEADAVVLAMFSSRMVPRKIRSTAMATTAAGKVAAAVLGPA